jgi:Type II secretion system (T2SS), protein E, N-terminal domain
MMLGEILIEAGALDQDGLQEALDWQVLYGGRLGTNLLELKLVNEEQLVAALRRRLGVEVLAGEIQLDPAMADLLPRQVVDRREIIPWKIEKRRLKLVCSAPDVGFLDELSVKLQRSCVAVVAPEFRIINALRTHFGAKRQMRALDFGVVPAEQLEARRKKRLKEQSPGSTIEEAPPLIDEAAFNDIYNQIVEGRAQGPKPEEAKPAAPPAAASWGVSVTPPVAPGVWPQGTPLPQGYVFAPPGSLPPSFVVPPGYAAIVPFVAPARGWTPGPPRRSGSAEAAPPSAAEAPQVQPAQPAAPPPPAKVPPASRSAPHTTPPSQQPVPPAPPSQQAPRPASIPASIPKSAPAVVKAAPASQPAAPAPAPEALEALPEDAILEELPEEAIESGPPLAPVAWEEPEAAAPPVDESPLDFKEALRLLEGVTDRDAIAHLVLRAARRFAARALLMKVQGGVALGWDGLGEGLTGAASGVAVPLAGEGAFQLVVRTRSHFLGPLQKTQSNIRFLAQCGKKVPLSSLLVPILHRGRVSHLLYLDNGHRQQAPTDVGEMLILSQRIAQTVDALVERRRAAR